MWPFRPLGELLRLRQRWKLFPTAQRDQYLMSVEARGAASRDWEVLYRPGDDKGIIPFNFNIDAHGKVIKGQFLCLAETLEACSGLLNRAWTELPVEWGYDRD